VSVSPLKISVEVLFVICSGNLFQSFTLAANRLHIFYKIINNKIAVPYDNILISSQSRKTMHNFFSQYPSLNNNLSDLT
jgi:hypothetical protein